MAKNNILNTLKKSKADFNLIGKAKITDFTFKIEEQSSKQDSDWVYNMLKLGVDCGENGTIYAEMMGGYGTDRENIVYVHGKKEENGNIRDDFNNRFTIAWDDREDEQVLETIGDMCYITVGLEKDVNDKTVYKKFLTEYDAIKYVNENLVEDMVINVKGNMNYSMYNDSLQCKKSIKSIVLSKAEEKDFRGTFTQAILIDGYTIGKLDKETNSIPLTCMIVDRVTEHDGKAIVKKVNGKTIKGTNLPLTKTFEFNVGEDLDKAKLMLKQFKVKSQKAVTQIVVDGYFSRGEVSTVKVSRDDIPDDIKELIELGYMEEEDILGKMAKANGGNNKPEVMIIKAPHIVFKGEETKVPSIDKTIDIYTIDDVNINMILESFNEVKEEEKVKEEVKKEEITEDEALEMALESTYDSEDDDNDDWLNNL